MEQAAPEAQPEPIQATEPEPAKEPEPESVSQAAETPVLEPATVEAASEPEPEPVKEPALEPAGPTAAPTPAAAPAYSAALETTTCEAGDKSFEADPLVDKKTLMLGAAGLCGLIFIIFIASIFNVGTYYVRQNKGAVEIWKGDFSPLGRDRLMVLHGAHWPGAIKDGYSRNEVFPFAAVYYLEKAKALTEAPVSEDFDRMADYLARVKELCAGRQYKETVAAVDQAGQTLADARVLLTSGQDTDLPLAQEKLQAVGQALEGLIAGLAGESPVEHEAEAGH